MPDRPVPGRRRWRGLCKAAGTRAVAPCEGGSAGSGVRSGAVERAVRPLTSGECPFRFRSRVPAAGDVSTFESRIRGRPPRQRGHRGRSAPTRPARRSPDRRVRRPEKCTRHPLDRSRLTSRSPSIVQIVNRGDILISEPPHFRFQIVLQCHAPWSLHFATDRVGRMRPGALRPALHSVIRSLAAVPTTAVTVDTARSMPGHRLEFGRIVAPPVP